MRMETDGGFPPRALPNENARIKTTRWWGIWFCYKGRRRYLKSCVQKIIALRGKKNDDDSSTKRYVLEKRQNADETVEKQMKWFLTTHSPFKSLKRKRILWVWYSPALIWSVSQEPKPPPVVGSSACPHNTSEASWKPGSHVQAVCSLRARTVPSTSAVNNAAEVIYRRGCSSSWKDSPG